MTRCIQLGALMLAVLFVFGTGCTCVEPRSARNAAKGAQYNRGDPDAQLADVDIISLKTAAFAGDGPAAMRLATYYNYYMHDFEEHDLWVFVAIADGYEPAILQQAAVYSHSEAPQLRLRAHKWLEQLTRDENYRHAAAISLDQLSH